MPDSGDGWDRPALLNQYLVISTGGQQTPGLGNINPQLYSLRQSNPAIFNDITTGNNDVTVTTTAMAGCGRHQTCGSETVGYNAGVGYDNVTGLGSVNAWSLITGWKGGPTVVTPPTPAAAGLSLVGNLSSVGQSDVVFLTATATANDGVSTPQGVVQFSSGGTSLGPVTLVGAGGISTATLQLRGEELPIGSTTVTATYDGSSSSAPVTSSVTLNIRAVSSSNGKPAIQGLTDSASYQQRYSPGMIMSVWGASLASSGTAESAGGVPLPVTIAGISATVNGVAAALYYVSPTQLNIQIPYQTAVGVPATLAIDNNGQVTTRTFELGAASPGIFTDTKNSIVCGCSERSRGQTTTLYFAGAGAVTPAIPRYRLRTGVEYAAGSAARTCKYHHHCRRRACNHVVYRHPLFSGWCCPSQLPGSERDFDRASARGCQCERDVERCGYSQHHKLIFTSPSVPQRPEPGYLSLSSGTPAMPRFSGTHPRRREHRPRRGLRRGACGRWRL